MTLILVSKQRWLSCMDVIRGLSVIQMDIIIRHSAPLKHLSNSACCHDLDYRLHGVPSERGVCGLLTSGKHQTLYDKV